MRGDGRPDYAYNGWVLYADTVQPPRLPASGGPIVIRGMGFRPSDTVLIGGQKAVVTSISPNEITAVAPAATPGVTGSVDVEVDDLPMFYAMTILSGGISYDSGNRRLTHPRYGSCQHHPHRRPHPLHRDRPRTGPLSRGRRHGHLRRRQRKRYALLRRRLCPTSATGDGIATINVTPSAGASVVTASLTNGASLQAHFSGGTPPDLAALTPTCPLLPAQCSTGLLRLWCSPAAHPRPGRP